MTRVRTAPPGRPSPPGLARIGDAAGDRQFAIALARGLEVLRAFTHADRALSNRELCERTGLPKATVSRMTHTLTLLGYLTRNADQRVGLGAGVLALGYPLLAGMPVQMHEAPVAVPERPTTQVSAASHGTSHALDPDDDTIAIPTPIRRRFRITAKDIRWQPLAPGVKSPFNRRADVVFDYEAPAPTP